VSAVVISLAAARQAGTLRAPHAQPKDPEMPDLTQRVRKRQHAQRMLAFAESQLQALRQNRR